MSLTNSQYDAVMRIYHSIQLKNKHIMDERSEEVYSACPEIKETEDAIISLSIDTAPTLIESNTNTSDLLLYKTKLNELIHKREKLLLQSGYPNDYLEEIFDCPLCKDTGFIGNSQCICFKKKAIGMLYLQANLKNILSDENFENFSFDYYSKNYIDAATGLTPYNNMQKVVSICKNFIEDFDTSFQNLLFYGASGTGKTFLSNCISGEIISSSRSVIYLTAIELFDTFSDFDSFSGKFNSGNTMKDYVLACDLLIIDDLGTELSNSFTNSKLFYCINERILKRKSTIISTNLSIKELASTYSERIFSRISSYYTILKLYGEDIRMKKRNMAK